MILWSNKMTRKSPSSKRKTSAVSLLIVRPREVAATEFKVHCLELLSEVERLGAEIVITRHRKPVARLAPLAAASRRFCGSLAGMIEWEGDLISPIDVEWTADEANFA
jgi:prevent-host-death family protein